MRSTSAIACAQENSSTAGQWSSLPDDLLTISYLRLTAPVDRVRFAAVCTAWRAVASPHLPRSVLPWLILDPSGGHKTERVYCPEESVALPRLHLPGEAVRRCFVGSHDQGWVPTSEAPFRIINFFSGAEVALSSKCMFRTRQRMGDPLVLRKVIFSEEPILSSCIVAAITNVHELAFCKVGCPESGWTIRGLNRNGRLMDIAFCNGELYGITRDTKRLIKYEFGVNEHEELDVNVRSLCMLNNYEIKSPDEHIRYILEIRGNLVMVVSNYTLHINFTAIEKNNFTVFELVHSHSYSWAKLNNLRDYALFLGPTGSKAVRVPASGWGEMQKNHIYFSHHRCLRRNDKIPNGVKVFWKSLNDDGYRVYYKKDESFMDGVKGIMSTGYYAMGGVHPPMWLFPERCAEG